MNSLEQLSYDGSDTTSSGSISILSDHVPLYGMESGVVESIAT